MELTARTLQEVTFGPKVRGYDPTEVDEFIAAVAEGVEELQERLRRTSERAARAEQQLSEAAATGGQAAAGPVTPATASAEIAKVWERAAAAAEAAVDEARQEAERLLEEARREAEAQLNDARQRAEAQLSDAQREAESTVGSARSEAQRLADESQGQLRAELAQLQETRERLKQDVDNLAAYVDGEVHRVRNTLTGALAALDAYGTASAATPEVAPVDIPPQEPSQWNDDQPENQQPGAWGDNGGASNGAPEAAWDSPPEGGYDGGAEGPQWEQAHDEGTPEPWSEPSQQDQGDQGQQPWGEQQQWGEQPAWSEPNPQAQQDDEADPFLAELRRAVQDEGPLGPRDGNPDEDDSSIDRLYANDDEDEDKSGFFRRKK